MRNFNVTWKVDLQCLAMQDVVEHIKQEFFKEGIGKPLIVIARDKNDPDGITASFTYQVFSENIEMAVKSIMEYFIHDAFEDTGVIFSVIDWQGGSYNTVKFHKGTIQIAA